MKTPNLHTPKSLIAWLEIATANLTAPAKERIRLEIEAHFLDAVENHLANGSKDVDARVSALKELGDPTTAAKRFRQKHLTRKEADYITSFLEISSDTYYLACSYAVVPIGIACGYLIYYLKKQPYPSMLFGGLALLLLVVSTTIFWEARRKSNLPSLLFLAALWEAIALIFVLLPCGSFGDWTGVLEMIFMTVLVLLFTGFSQRNSLWLKLRKTDNTWQEMPPTATS